MLVMTNCGIIKRIVNLFNKIFINMFKNVFDNGPVANSGKNCCKRILLEIFGLFGLAKARLRP